MLKSLTLGLVVFLASCMLVTTCNAHCGQHGCRVVKPSPKVVVPNVVVAPHSYFGNLYGYYSYPYVTFGYRVQPWYYGYRGGYYRDYCVPHYQHGNCYRNHGYHYHGYRGCH